MRTAYFGLGFVEGHGFSRAARAIRNAGFSPSGSAVLLHFRIRFCSRTESFIRLRRIHQIVHKRPVIALAQLNPRVLLKNTGGGSLHI